MIIRKLIAFGLGCSSCAGACHVSGCPRSDNRWQVYAMRLLSLLLLLDVSSPSSLGVALLNLSPEGRSEECVRGGESEQRNMTARCRARASGTARTVSPAFCQGLRQQRRRCGQAGLASYPAPFESGAPLPRDKRAPGPPFRDPLVPACRSQAVRSPAVACKFTD